MEKFLYPRHPVRCINTGPSECGISVSLTNLILNIFNEFEKLYNYSLSLHQDLHQKLNQSLSNYILLNIIPNILREEDIDLVIDEIVNHEDFEKSDTEIETYECIEKLKYPLEYDDGGIILLDDLNENKMGKSRAQAMFD